MAVAEYRPNSRSIVYRVDPETMKATEVFRFADHIGAVVRNTDDNTLHGVSWGSRRFYRWTLGDDGRVTNADVPADSLRRLNPSHYVDYQDCKYIPRGRMLCTGVADLRHGPDSPSFGLGGLELIDLRDGRPLHQIPIALLTPSSRLMTQNPVWLEATAIGPARLLLAGGRPIDALHLRRPLAEQVSLETRQPFGAVETSAVAPLHHSNASRAIDGGTVCGPLNSWYRTS